MAPRTKNRPFKTPHVVRHVAACLWPAIWRWKSPWNRTPSQERPGA